MSSKHKISKVEFWIIVIPFVFLTGTVTICLEKFQAESVQNLTHKNDTPQTTSQRLANSKGGQAKSGSLPQKGLRERQRHNTEDIEIENGVLARIATNIPRPTNQNITFAGQNVPLMAMSGLPETVHRASQQTGVIRNVLKRRQKWFPYIEKEARKLGLHADVKYLFIQESELDPKAKSQAGAGGICQFMKSTARDYGLNAQERFDPYKAIPACLQYLKDLKNRFGGDIFLALAAYNAGPQRLSGALTKSSQVSYFALGSETGLKTETLEFVPKIIAWKLLFERPGQYGIDHRTMANVSDR